MSNLSIALRAFAIVSIVVGMVFCVNSLSYVFDGDGWAVMVTPALVLIGGIILSLVLFALAMCVDAAKRYLDRHPEEAAE